MATVHVTDHDGGVRVLTLDRPPANALDETLLTELGDAVATARAAPDVRAVVLTASPPFFSGGFDLAAARRDARAAAALRALYRDSHLALLHFPKPLVGAMNGHAVAGGLVLLLACDVRLGLDGDYQLGLNEVAIGASFPRVALEIVRLRLGPAAATELLLGARLCPAREHALRLGVVEQLLPPAELHEAAVTRARALADVSLDAYAHTKAALVAPAIAATLGETATEAERGAAVWTTPESRAVRARHRERLGIGRRR